MDVIRRHLPLLVCLLASLAGRSAPADSPVELFDDVPDRPAALRDDDPRARAPGELRRPLRVARQNAADGPLSDEALAQKQLDSVRAQLAAAEKRQTEEEIALADLQQQLETLRASGPSEPRPYSFLLLDRLRDDLIAERDKELTVRDRLDAVQEALVRARTDQEAKERARRQAKEALETNRDESAQPALAAALARAEFASRVAEETVELRGLELAAEKLDQESYGLRLELLQERIHWIAQDVRFTEADLEEQLLELQKQEQDIQRSLASAEASVVYVERQWFEARTRLDDSPEKNGALGAEVEARRLARQTVQQQITLLNQRLARLEQRRKMWDARYAVAAGEVENNTVRDWADEARAAVAQLEREERLQTMRTSELRADMAAVVARLEATPEPPEAVARWLHEQQNQLQSQIQYCERNLAGIESSLRLHEKFLSQVETDSLAETTRERLASFRDTFVTVWNWEITSVDDRPITVRKIVMGLTLLLVGVLLSRLLSALLGRRFLPRLGVNRSAAAALQSVAFYTLLVLFALFALRVINVPLTAFTVLGGALALGVGFGSQNVINNFISGLILLAERPVKVGDLVQVEELYGNIDKIGARSTWVKTGNNLEVVVPNSALLQNNVINFTLSNDHVRASIRVGVIYGSPVEQVTELLMKAAREHELVHSRPEPLVLFSDFGDDALIFELHFWITMRSMMERLTIESDIRYRIDALFKEANLVIAFPQRDVHLDTATPLEVRMLPAAAVTTPGDSLVT